MDDMKTTQQMELFDNAADFPKWEHIPEKTRSEKIRLLAQLLLETLQQNPQSQSRKDEADE